jgi:ADP-heptose:LPS heptosyltransferase
LSADLDRGPGAFLDTAAVIAGLDLVISSDTSDAHLAEARGRPV